ncbi:MAG: leucine--tRNA ligase [Candidatus Roizmanbacteria bacterium]|nr:leucine--tRNA ligase [Candidatus Roizmanbacteria bacterium]
MKEYAPATIEEKWRTRWKKDHLYTVSHLKGDKKYILDMFPYPSGAGLHVGHVEGYTGTDVLSRFYRMRGFTVLHPMGWDAFGLPAENYAVKTGIHPSETTQKAIVTFTKQMQAMGFSYDWSKELGTHTPAYYRWTQWLFLILYKKGLAYRAKAQVNWCPSCKTVLANEQVVNGECERCHSLVIQKDMEQWFFRITAYAERLLQDLEKLDWPNSTKLGQIHWIGKSEGITITYTIDGSDQTIECFTTWPTNWGASFLVLAPEHHLVQKITTQSEKKAVDAYLSEVQMRSESQRIKSREKTGVFTGSYALNQVTGKKIPIWVSDFVIAHVGTGAIQGCPGHDMRDFEFAKKFNLPIPRVVVGEDGDTSEIESPEQVLEKGQTGKMMNSDFLDGMEYSAGIQKTKEYFVEKGWGKLVVNYKLRDWLVSRQRYWGAPIPMLFCDKCGWQSVADSDLPVKLPNDVDFKPTGESPLVHSQEFNKGIICPQCGGKARREADTMDTFVDSSWYYMRFADPNNAEHFADKEKLRQWLPVDMYVGGAEHTVLHLLYSRFITKVLYDEGYVTFDEPFVSLRHPGTILGPDGVRMSKSRGNVINPDDEVSKFGADTVRMYELFMGPFKDMKPWSTSGGQGLYRFLKKVWNIYSNQAFVKKSPERIEKLLHKLIQKMTKDIAALKFNTALAALMEFVNNSANQLDKSSAQIFLLLLAPFAPYITEELWETIGGPYSIHSQSWPPFDEEKTKNSTSVLAIQINGKLRATMQVESTVTEEEACHKALSIEKIQKLVQNIKTRLIYVPGKVINIVTVE